MNAAGKTRRARRPVFPSDIVFEDDESEANFCAAARRPFPRACAAPQLVVIEGVSRIAETRVADFLLWHRCGTPRGDARQELMPASGKSWSALLRQVAREEWPYLWFADATASLGSGPLADFLTSAHSPPTLVLLAGLEGVVLGPVLDALAVRIRLEYAPRRRRCEVCFVDPQAWARP